MEGESAGYAYNKQPKKASSFLCDIVFSHGGLFIVVMLYTAVGALAFVALERGTEETRYEKKMVKASSVNQSINYISQLFWFYQAQTNWTIVEFSEAVTSNLTFLEGSILEAISNNGYDGTVTGWTYDWTFAKCTLLTMSIITTIGYGHIAPKTFYGQMFCIVYALVGCPLLLLFLANVGDAMASTLTYFYSRCLCRMCRARRYLSELTPGSNKKLAKQVIDDVVGEEDFMPTKSVTVPIIINLVLLAAYIVIGALIFVQWEDWKFHTSCYFTFITISTIGYGDKVPQSAMVEDLAASFWDTFKMFFIVLYLLFGMAMLSMAVNLMQDQLVEKCRWMAKEVGLSKDPQEEKKDKDPEVPKRKESVAALSVPEPNLTPSAAPTRPASALSVLPGSPEVI